jgi:hypothetical protein
MRRRMLALRDIAAPDVTAGEAESEMHPIHPKLQAFLTSFGCFRLNVVDLVQMTASFWHTKPATNGFRKEFVALFAPRCKAASADNLFQSWYL